jgi:plastocyanin
MTRRTALLAALGTLALAITAPAIAEHGDTAGNDSAQSVTVSFGAGLNTAQPGNSANHQILPRRIKVAQGGVVNFVVAGFHQITIYQPGVSDGDIEAAAILLPPAATFINFATDVYYQGLSPTGAAPAGFSNAQNRVESVSFSKKGTYLVICNLLSHFRDGMYAYVEVGDSRDGNDDKSGHEGHDSPQ